MIEFISRENKKFFFCKTVGFLPMYRFLPLVRWVAFAIISFAFLPGCLAGFLVAYEQGADWRGSALADMVERYERKCTENNGKLALGPGLTEKTVTNADKIDWSKGMLRSTYTDWDNMTCKGMDQKSSPEGRACASKGGVLRFDVYHRPGFGVDSDSIRKPTLSCDTSAASMDVNAEVKPFVDSCSSLGGKLGMKAGISVSESAVAFRKAKGWNHSPYFYSRNPHLSAADFTCTGISNPPAGLGRACVQLGGDLTISTRNPGPEGYKCTFETEGGTTVDISDQMRLKINQSKQVELDRQAGLNTIPALAGCARRVKLAREKFCEGPRYNGAYLEKFKDTCERLKGQVRYSTKTKKFSECVRPDYANFGKIIYMNADVQREMQPWIREQYAVCPSPEFMPDSGACAVPNKDVAIASWCSGIGVWLVDKCIDNQGRDVTNSNKSALKMLPDEYSKCFALGGRAEFFGGCTLVSRYRTYEVGNLLKAKFSGEEHEKFVKLCRAKGQVIGNRCFNSFKDDITSVIARQIQPVPPEAATAGRQSKGGQKEEIEELGEAEVSIPTCFNTPITSPWYIANC